MNAERDDYEVFLDSWEPDPLLEHATLAPNINDPLVRQRLLEDSTGAADLARTPFASGLKVMDEQEKWLRGYAFFEDRQPRWSTHFRDRVLSAGVDSTKLELFITSFATLWVDGRSRRQDSRQMMAIKASIRDYDRLCHPEQVDRYVLNPVDDNVAPLFSPQEMAAILTANEGLLEAFMPDYLDHLGDHGAGSINDLYIRRGVYMPERRDVRSELHQLSSYSLALGPVEQFAQTWTQQTRATGVPSIFSAPLPAVQNRVVAFAPFIEGMDLSQLELVVAPPIAPMPLRHLGEHGGIHEFEFD